MTEMWHTSRWLNVQLIKLICTSTNIHNNKSLYLSTVINQQLIALSKTYNASSHLATTTKIL